MRKFLALIIFTFSMLLVPVEKTAIIADQAQTKAKKKVFLNTISQEELLLKEMEDLEFIPSFNEEKENNSDYSKIQYKEVSKTISYSELEPVKSKVIEAEKLKVKDNIELSYDEIEEQEFKSGQTELTVLASFDFEIRNYKTELEDRISTAVAANEKSNNSSDNSKPLERINTPDDELVFFDYSEDGKVNVLDSNPISPVEYEQDMQKKEVTKVTHQIAPKLSSQKRVESSQNLIDIQKIKKRIQSSSEKVAKNNGQNIPETKVENDQKNKGEMNGFVNNDKSDSFRCLQAQSREKFKSDYSLSLIGVDYSKGEYSKVYNFDLEFNDNGQSLSDNGTGEINLNFNLTSSMNIRRGTILNNKIYPLTMDFVFEGGSEKIMIPVFERTSFDGIVSSLGITGEGGHLLFQLDDETEDLDLEINTNYQAKLYLDNNLEVINRSENEYAYILYIGVDLGNTIVTFKNNKNELVSKIIHVTEDEIYYDPNFYANFLNDEISFFQENLTTQCKSLLNISKNDINSWSFDSKPISKSLNTVSFDKMIYPLGSRKYFQLGHLEEPIFIGHWSESKIIIPSEAYIRHVLDSLDVNENSCVIQINLTSKLKNVSFTERSANSQMRAEISYLDDDGIFYDEGSSDTRKLFISGEEEGIVNLKINYSDGSSQFIQTYCSDNTYLVEQL